MSRPSGTTLYRGVGCFSSISVPYDCEEGRDHIEARWSSKKQAMDGMDG